MAKSDRKWIDKEELENVQVKWGWSHFAGRAEGLNSAGDHNFTIILPEDIALTLLDKGWTGVKQTDPHEEYEPEWVMKIRVSDQFEVPKIFFIKNGKPFRQGMNDLQDIRRDCTEKLDVVIAPSFWEQPGRSGVSAYAEELYATIRESRFASRYLSDDVEIVD